MNAVDLQQFGEMVQAVKNVTKAVDEQKAHLEKTADEMKEGFEKVHKRIDDHMDKEEEERKELIALIRGNSEAHARGREESNSRMNKLEWRLGAIAAVLGMGGSAVGPFIGKLVETAFFEDIAVSVLTYLPW